MALAVVGCKNHNHDNDMSTQNSKNMMTQDDCASCPGIQHADANGKCPQCGMKVK
jgi:hypothetical protein